MQIGGRDGDALRARRLRFEMQGGGVTGWRLELQAQSCRVARGWAWPGVMGGGPSSTLTGQFCRRFPGAGKCSVRGGTGKTWCLIGQVSSIFCGQQSRPSPAQVLACRVRRTH